MKKLHLTLIGSSIALALACGGVAGTGNDGSGSGSSGSGAKGNGTGSTGNGSGASDGLGGAGNGTGASSGTGSTGSGAGTGGVPFPDDTFTYDPSKDAAPTSCVNQSVGTTQLPVDMFIIIDSSGSMTTAKNPDGTSKWGSNDARGDCDVDQSGWQDINSRWCNSINAFQDFLEAPSSVGMGVSVDEFASTGCSDFSPMAVPYGEIKASDSNGLLASVETTLNGWSPGGSTNTEGAIRTLVASTSSWHDSVSNTRDVPIVAILVTDGAPNGCITKRTGSGSLNELMANHFNSAYAIPTFIIGMDGVSASNLDDLATGAGAKVHTDYCLAGDPDCSYYSVGNGDAAAFAGALAAIRKQVMGCSFGIPSDSGGLIDLSSADVVFTETSAASPETLVQVANLAACTTSTQYYVETDKIQLCPNTCGRVGGDSSISIDIKCKGN